MRQWKTTLYLTAHGPCTVSSGYLSHVTCLTATSKCHGLYKEFHSSRSQQRSWDTAAADVTFKYNALFANTRVWRCSTGHTCHYVCVRPPASLRLSIGCVRATSLADYLFRWLADNNGQLKKLPLPHCVPCYLLFSCQCLPLGYGWVSVGCQRPGKARRSRSRDWNQVCVCACVSWIEKWTRRGGDREAPEAEMKAGLEMRWRMRRRRWTRQWPDEWWGTCALGCVRQGEEWQVDREAVWHVVCSVASWAH